MPGVGDLKQVAGVLRAADKIKEYQIILDAQEKLLEQQEKISELKEKVAKLEKKKEYIYEDDHSWLIDPKNPNRKLCPVCMNRDGFENPLESQYCRTCKKYAE